MILWDQLGAVLLDFKPGNPGVLSVLWDGKSLGSCGSFFVEEKKKRVRLSWEAKSVVYDGEEGLFGVGQKRRAERLRIEEQQVGPRRGMRVLRPLLTPNVGPRHVLRTHRKTAFMRRAVPPTWPSQWPQERVGGL